MKFKVLTIVILAVLGLSMTQSTSNDCKTYYPLAKGMKWTYQEFNKKGNLDGTSTTFVEDVIYTESKTEYKIKVTSTDAKGNTEEGIEGNTFSYICENGILKMDMSQLIPQETQDGFSDMEVSIEQTEMAIPSTLKAGQKLDDASITMKVSSGGMDIMTITVHVTDRKVEKMESITTDAGTFNSALMTYKTSMKMGFMNTTSTSKDWLSPEVGLVKSESYDKNGKLMSSRVLSEFSK